MFRRQIFHIRQPAKEEEWLVAAALSCLPSFQNLVQKIMSPLASQLDIGVMAAPKPSTLRRRMHDNCSPAARCIRATLFGRIDHLQFPSLRVRVLIGKISAVGVFGGEGNMNPRRLATAAAALCGTVVLAGWVVAWLAGFGSAGIESTGAAPIDGRRTPSLIADAEFADASQATVKGDAANADVSIEDRRTPSLTADAERADAPQAAAMGNAANADVSAANADVSIEDRRTPSLAADAELADAPQATAMGNAAVAKADVATAAEAVTVTAADTAAASNEPASIAEAASPDSSRMPPPETSSAPVVTASIPDPVPNNAKQEVSSIEILDECLVADSCIDRYLWALYQRTPKVDTIKVEERRKVTVRKKGKTVTVTKSFTNLVEEDFTWKDPKAAEKAGMPMMDYVIGGMDRSFKLKLFHALHAAEEAGLSPGITSAFRDDYRQSIASGLKAATDRSYHGGSFRGGYGHGLAADAVSVKGATKAERWTATENLWKWIDAHGEEFGIGRPYLDRDPPHLAPIDGQEYAAHHGGTKAQHAGSDIKKHNRLAVRDDRSVAKRRTARSSKVRTI